MHLEAIEGASGPCLQALIRLPWLPRAKGWRNAYARRLAALSGLGALATAFRMTVTSAGEVMGLISATVPVREALILRRFLARLQWLEGLEVDSVQPAETPEQHQAWILDLPTTLRRVVPPPLSAGGAWLASPFRVGRHLTDLANEAISIGAGFTYQVYFCPFRPDPEEIRRVRRNFLQLQTLAGFPQAALETQRRIADGFADATLLVEEMAGAEDAASTAWLSSALQRAWRQDAAPGEGPDIRPFADADEVGLMLPSRLLYGDQEPDDLLASQAEPEAFRLAVMGGRPDIESVRPSADDDEAPPREPPAPQPTGPALPRAFEGRDHVFISYKHTDMPRIAATIRWLSDRGFPIWYDRGIEGGEEWDAVLERKIEEAAALLFFSSRLAVESKYCRREVKFADALDKPILTVALEPVELRHGLRFLLQHLQQLDIGDADFEARLEQALRRVLGQRP